MELRNSCFHIVIVEHHFAVLFTHRATPPLTQPSPQSMQQKHFLPDSYWTSHSLFHCVSRFASGLLKDAHLARRARFAPLNIPLAEICNRFNHLPAQ